MRWARNLIVCGLCLAPAAQAQSTPPLGVTEILLIQLRELVDAFDYPAAIRLGAASSELIAQMRPDQLELYLTLTAAANFPPEADSLQHRELALQHLQSLVRLRPDARIPVELSWDGLDLLLDEAASQVFSIAVRPTQSYDLAGSEARGFVYVVASRLTDFRLVSVSGDGDVVVVQDSIRTGSSGNLGFRIHDGVRRLLLSGENQIRVIAHDVATGDSTELRFGVLVAAESPEPLPLPVLDSAALLPVRQPPNRASIVRTGIFYAVLTGVAASAARAGEPIRSNFAIDVRAFAVSAAMIGAAITAAARDPGRALPANVIVNDRTRVEHAAAVEAVVAENQRRRLQYRATIRTLMVVAP